MIVVVAAVVIITTGYYLWETGILTGDPDDEVNDDVSDLSLDLEDVVLTRSYWTDAGLVELQWYTHSKWTSSGSVVPQEWERDSYFLFLKINLTNTGDEDIDLSGYYFVYGIGDYIYYNIFNRPLAFNRSENDPRYVSDTPITSDLLLSPSDSITGWFITSVNDTISKRDTITVGSTLESDVWIFPSSGGIVFPSLEVDIGNARVYESIQPRLSMEVVQHTFNASIDGYQPLPGNRFVVVDLVLRTEWDFDMVVRVDDLSLVDDGNETYGVSPASEALPGFNESHRFGSSRDLSMSLVFEVPISSDPVLLLLEDDVSVEAVI